MKLLKTINFYPEMFGGEIEIENNESNIICYNDLPPTITTKTDGFPTGAENGEWIRTCSTHQEMVLILMTLKIK